MILLFVFAGFLAENGAPAADFIEDFQAACLSLVILLERFLANVCEEAAVEGLVGEQVRGVVAPVDLCEGAELVAIHARITVLAHFIS